MTDFGSIRNHFSLIDIAARYLPSLEKSTGGEYKAICPFHDDSKPSLTFYSGDDGNWHYFCFACDAGAEGGDVIDFVCNIEHVSAPKACEIIQGEKLPAPGTFTAAPPSKKIESTWTPIVPVPDDAPPYNPRRTYNPKQDAWKQYKPSLKTAYKDAESRVLFYVVRMKVKDGKACITVSYCKGPNDENRWCAKRPKPPYPLLGLEGLAAEKEKMVLLVEGEKAYDRAKREPALKGFVPVSWLGGTKAVDSIDLSPLAGRWIAYSPDVDAEGEKAMLSIHNLIEKSGTG